MTTVMDNNPADDVLEIRVELYWNEPVLGLYGNGHEEVYTLLAEGG